MSDRAMFWGMSHWLLSAFSRLQSRFSGETFTNPTTATD